MFVKMNTQEKILVLCKTEQVLVKVQRLMFFFSSSSSLWMGTQNGHNAPFLESASLKKMKRKVMSSNKTLCASKHKYIPYLFPFFRSKFQAVTADINLVSVVGADVTRYIHQPIVIKKSSGYPLFLVLVVRAEKQEGD